MTASPDRKKKRDAARDARQQRPRGKKMLDTFAARLEESEVIARILFRKHGLDLPRARVLALTANPPTEMLGKRGQPPCNHELYESVEVIRDANDGKLPTGTRAPFWPAFVRHWNAGQSEEHPERQFLTVKGEPDWRTLQAVYQAARRRLEAQAAAIAASTGPDS